MTNKNSVRTGCLTAVHYRTILRVSARFQWAIIVFEESTTGTSSHTVQRNRSRDWQVLYKQTKQTVKIFILVHMTKWLTLSFNNTTSEKRWDLKKVAVDTFYLYHDEWFLFASFPISPKWMEVCGILTKASNTKQIGPQCVLKFFHVSIEYRISSYSFRPWKVSSLE